MRVLSEPHLVLLKFFEIYKIGVCPPNLYQCNRCFPLVCTGVGDQVLPADGERNVTVTFKLPRRDCTPQKGASDRCKAYPHHGAKKPYVHPILRCLRGPICLWDCRHPLVGRSLEFAGVFQATCVLSVLLSWVCSFPFFLGLIPSALLVCPSPLPAASRVLPVSSQPFS